MGKINYLQKITAFNSDKDIIALREKYKEPTFFEIISKQRSENTYSSFLKWMFQSSCTDLNSASPILLLLDILVKHCETQIDDQFKQEIVTRDFKISKIEVETEKYVSELVSELKQIGKINADNLNEDQLIKTCEDRIDIFIKCTLDNDQELQIIIENKIDSNEGASKNNKQTNIAAYDNSLQTNRYYIATKRKDEKKIKQLYVYLSPSIENKCDCKQFIKITYQDIIDGIVVPMLATNSLSTRARFFLEELKTELTFPSLEGNNVKNSIAISNENSLKFGEIWEKYNQLIIDAAIADTPDTGFWYIKNGNNIIYYNHKPTKELCELTNTVWKKRTRYESVRQNIKEEYIESDECKIEKDIDLLQKFWENNKRFLLALMNGLPNEKRKNIEDITTEVSKTKNTKYRIYLGDKCLNNDWLKGKPANNSETAWIIINKWAEENNANNGVNLNTLRDKFNPKNCNPYYAQGNWLQHLFYEYNEAGIYKTDGIKNNGTEFEAGGWDIYKPKNNDDRKFRIKLSNGKDAIMLKVWRKDAVEKLIKLVTDSNNKYFKNELFVQPNK